MEKTNKKKRRKVREFLSHLKNSQRTSKLCSHSLANIVVVAYSKWQPIKYLSMKGLISTDGWRVCSTSRSYTLNDGTEKRGLLMLEGITNDLCSGWSIRYKGSPLHPIRSSQRIWQLHNQKQTRARETTYKNKQKAWHSETYISLNTVIYDIY